MPDKPTKPAAPAPFSRDWWDLRNAQMAEIAAEQARQRRDHPLAIDKNPALLAAIEARSKAAVELALYGHSEEREAIWDAACRREEAARK